jgi:hypothetical protein
MDARVEMAADFVKMDRSGKMTSSLAMQFAGFSASELCDRNLQRRVLRKRHLSPEALVMMIPFDNASDDRMTKAIPGFNTELQATWALTRGDSTESPLWYHWTSSLSYTQVVESRTLSP